jgi:crotonobetainyl-CoA:carnitine CoA-transferase CaiB-like acyl-CoA transferase
VTGPLADVRVLDLTRALAGPYSTMLLADLGADVVKVESPEGDLTRAASPLPPGAPYGGYFQSVNRNKRSIVLDLKEPSGRDTLLRLVAHAHALVENFRTGVMDRLGLSYETLREINRALVYASVRGFGDPRGGASPYADWPAFDVTAQAWGGFMGITGTADGTPQQAGPGVGDIFPGTLLALGVVTAIRHAERTGEGQYVDVAMYDGVLAMCERIVPVHSYTGEVPRPQGNAHPQFCPFGIFTASDGYVSIAAPTNNHWRALCEIIGRDELGIDDRYKNVVVRLEHRDEVIALLTDWTSSRTRAEIVDALGGRVPVGPVNTVADIVADPHIAAREMLAEVEQPGMDRPVVVPNNPIKLTRTPSGVRHRAPLLGEHTDEVLSRVLGLGEAAIGRLHDARVVAGIRS